MDSLSFAPVFPPDLPTSAEGLVLPIDKPKGWTSFDVIRKLRRVLGVRKIGHAGTLDPMATGLLICLVGRATRQMENFMEQPKAYSGTLRLGQKTASYDAETPVTEERAWSHVQMDDLDRARQAFIGDIEQIPPIYSAVKVGGERLYRKARRGETAVVPPRLVHVYDFQIVSKQGADVSFELECSRGTYVRSIAHDVGELLGTGAHLISLRRTAIGATSVERAWSLEMLSHAADAMPGGGVA